MTFLVKRMVNCPDKLKSHRILELSNYAGINLKIKNPDSYKLNYYFMIVLFENDCGSEIIRNK